MKKQPAHAVVHSSMDELIVAIYRIVRDRCTWEEWLTDLLQLTGMDEARLEYRLSGREIPIVARSVRHTCPGMSYQTYVVPGAPAQGATLVLKGSSPNSAVSLVEKLLPHVGRVLQLEDYLADERRYVEQVAATLADGVSVGVVLLHGSERSVVYANRLAYALAAGSAVFELSHDRLRVRDSVQARQLHRIIRAVACQSLRQGHYLLRGEDQHRLSVLCCRLSRCTYNYIDGNTSEFVVLFMADSAALPSLRAEFLQREYAFTPKEARLALGLAHGRTLDALADEFFVSRHTLRAQFKSIQKKAGIRSQAALVRLLVDDPRLLFVRGDKLSDTGV